MQSDRHMDMLRRLWAAQAARFERLPALPWLTIDAETGVVLGWDLTKGWAKKRADMSGRRCILARAEPTEYGGYDAAAD